MFVKIWGVIFILILVHFLGGQLYKNWPWLSCFVKCLYFRYHTGLIEILLDIRYFWGICWIISQQNSSIMFFLYKLFFSYLFFVSYLQVHCCIFKWKIMTLSQKFPNNWTVNNVSIFCNKFHSISDITTASSYNFLWKC